MLRPGARIAVVAPAGIPSAERLASGMATLRSWEYEPVPAPHLYARHRYLAGTTAERHADLRWALTAPDLDAVWYARGGYGTFAAMADLPWDELPHRPVLGFSDATALLTALARRGRPAVHAPVLQGLADPEVHAQPGAVLVDADSRAALRSWLTTGKTAALPGSRLCGPSSTVRGPVLGGNLAVLATLCGTSEQLDARGAILLLEDIGEAPYRLDRLWSQLVAAGCVDGVAGVVLGEFTGCEPPADAGFALAELWHDLLVPLGVPVVHGVPVGHGCRNVAWPVGGLGVLDATGLRFE